MKKVKITVLRTMFNEDLAAEYGTEGLAACPFHREGQVFYADYAKPEGLCDEAWKAICSCNDGLRPVIFKLETTQEEE